jgi:hypothetical protein
VKTSSITVHAIEVLDNRFAIDKAAATIRAAVAEALPHQCLVFFTVNSDPPALGDTSAQFVKEHADNLIRHVGLSPPRGGA